MLIVYYVNGNKFTTDELSKIPWNDISSLNKHTPAYENKITGDRIWCMKNLIRHRLTGPAIFRSNHKEFWINGKFYYNIHDWLKDHPNQNETFKTEMLELWS
jgi:hypothetical protein